MRSLTDYLNAIVLVFKRALEGRISPFNFLLIIGFFSSVVLLYITLHVHFATITGEINDGLKTKEVLSEELASLTAEHNRLTSPDRIIPIVVKQGLKAGTAGEIRRIAFYNNREQYRREAAWWAQAGRDQDRRDLPYLKPGN